MCIFLEIQFLSGARAPTPCVLGPPLGVRRSGGIGIGSGWWRGGVGGAATGDACDIGGDDPRRYCTAAAQTTTTTTTMDTTTEAATPSSERRVGPRLSAKRVAGSVDIE
jgi:hypothetical protein